MKIKEAYSGPLLLGGSSSLSLELGGEGEYSLSILKDSYLSLKEIPLSLEEVSSLEVYFSLEEEDRNIEEGEEGRGGILFLGEGEEGETREISLLKEEEGGRDNKGCSSKRFFLEEEGEKVYIFPSPPYLEEVFRKVESL